MKKVELQIEEYLYEFYNDYRMEKTIEFSIVFSAKRYVLRRMIL